MKSARALLTKAAGAGSRALAVNTAGVRRVRRPARGGSPEFDLAYVRVGPRSRIPTVIIPGGPGLASILPYRSLRRDAAANGLDIIMVEHRGVGLSRHDITGQDLPRSAMWIKYVVEDIAAVLEAEDVNQAYLAGASYGSYLASSFAATYPQLVSGMLLDSALQAASDLGLERAWIRDLLWEGDSALAKSVRQLADREDNERALLGVVRGAYELGGATLAQAVLTQRLVGGFTPAWRALATYTAREPSMLTIRDHFEFARAGTIGFRELDYGAEPDGLPLDPALTYQPLAGQYPSFVGEPFDLPAHTPNFAWPMVLLAGSRDLRTPYPIAERTASMAPAATLIKLENGHSAMDTHPLAFVKSLKMLVAGEPRKLTRYESQLNDLPRRGAANTLTRFLWVASQRGSGSADH